MKVEARLNAWNQLYIPSVLCRHLSKDLDIYPQSKVLFVIDRYADLGEVLHQIQILEMEVQHNKKRSDDENALQGSSSYASGADDYGSKDQ